MQRSIVSFVDPDMERTIEVTFELDENTNNLNYDVKVTPEMEKNEDYGLNLYLANMFLSLLQAQANYNEQAKDNVTETVNED